VQLLLVRIRVLRHLVLVPASLSERLGWLASEMKVHTSLFDEFNLRCAIRDGPPTTSNTNNIQLLQHCRLVPVNANGLDLPFPEHNSLDLRTRQNVLTGKRGTRGSCATLPSSRLPSTPGATQLGPSLNLQSAAISTVSESWPS